jgi:hypothetical protein
MRATLGFAVMVTCVLSACQLPMSNSSTTHTPTPAQTQDEPTTGERPALSCAPKNSSWPTVEALYGATDESVHELITCGGLQIRVASDIVMMLIASNKDLFKKDERAYIDQLMLNPFTQTSDGRWTMPIDGTSDSTFTLAFYDPDSGDQIHENVFDLDSYLTGLHIQTDVGLTTMLQDPETKHPFVFTWTSPGPLARLLNDGKPLPDGFTLQLSLSDFVGTPASEFGPFASVFNVELDSVVDYLDHQPGADIDYKVTTVRDQMKHITSTQSLAFHVDHLAGTADKLTLDGNTDNLTFVHLGDLAGRIDYTLSGKLDGASVHMSERDDFGDGARYPTTHWLCP